MGLELVTRRGCHLCEGAAAALLAAGLSFTEVDVDGDGELSRLYDFRVPVVLRDGAVLLEGRIDLDRVRAALR